MQNGEMQNDEPCLTDASRAPGSNHDDSPGRVQLSANMTSRLEKLVRWRISPSLLKFQEGGRQSEGGYATVSRALLGSPPDGTEAQLMESSVASFPSSTRTLELGGDNECREVEESDQGTGSKDEAEVRVQESDGETSGPWKAVAVKKMKMDISDDVVRVLGLTIREAEFLVGMSHENIIKLEGFVEDVSKKMIWLVFPWEENGTLQNFIASADWEIPERIWLIDDVARGVEYLHGTKPPICHGDLKSMNILVNSKFRAVITDFGSAHHPVVEGHNTERERAENEPPPAAEPPIEATFCPSANTITLKGVQYTTRWAAPELLERDVSGLASDVWAFGWVAYEVMTNYIPFHDVKEPMVVIRVVRGDLPSISNDTRMLLIQALCSIVGRCWNIDPSKRPTAEECRKSIQWMASKPMAIPNPVRTADAADFSHHTAELFMKLGDMHLQQGDYPNASKYLAEALGVYTNIADNQGKADALVELGKIYLVQPEYSQVVKLYSEALQIYTNIGNGQGRASTFFGLAEVHRARNEYSQAATFYSECLQIRTAIGDIRGRAEALSGLAVVHLLRNESRQAVALYSECLQISTDLGNRKGRANALYGLAEVHRTQKELSQALTYYSECLQIRTDLGDRRGRANALWGLASVHKGQHEYSQAVTFYSEDLQIQTEIGDKRGRAEALCGLAEVHRLQKEYSQAVKFYSEALQIRKDTDDRRGKAEALWGLAEVHRLRKEYSRAMTFFDECLQIYTDIGDRGLGAFTMLCIADAHRDQDNRSGAIHRYEQAAKIFKEIGNNHHEAIALNRAADVRRLMEQQAVA